MKLCASISSRIGALGIGIRAALTPFVTAPLLAGIVFLTLLAFTSIARGNIPAAICSATVSNLAGVALVALLLEGGSASTMTFDSVWKIVALLLLPFAIGHALRPFTASWHERNRGWLGYVDRGSILLVVYAAFSASVLGVPGACCRCEASSSSSSSPPSYWRR